ncbi:MAG TPA: DUF4157 domain-containing protein [Actinomycetota bacterium]|nr:DUF4157 domain-containing protein [Actinomycetota bacterium]
MNALLTRRTPPAWQPVRAAARPAVMRVPAPTLQRCGGVQCPAGTCDHSDEPVLARAVMPGHAIDRLPLRDPAPRGTLSGIRMTQPGDSSEVEADHVADRILRMPDPGTAAAIPATAPPARTGGGSGTPLPPGVRAFFEPRFGRDFSGVRVHTGDDASRAARSVGAAAFTLGSDITFGSGRLQPDSDRGRRLLAHELTHVVQQGGAVQRQVDDDGGGGGVGPGGGIQEMDASGANVRYRCGEMLGCPLIENCNGRPCALADCGRGSCQNPLCRALGLDNIIWRAWCSYRCVPSGSAFVMFTTIGNVKVGPFCLD